MQMGKKQTLLALLTVAGLGSGLGAILRAYPAAESMNHWGAAWVAELEPQQREQAVLKFEDQKRTDWHFIPKAERKGLQLKDMSAAQKAAALRFLRAALSEAGYDKSVKIMELEEILRITEGAKARFARDPQRYFFTVFGEPGKDAKWGLSVEGHHLSLNFVVSDGKIVDSTPQFMGANPATVKTQLPGLPNPGVRVLGDEEQLAFDLLKALDSNAKKLAVIAAEAPAEIRAAGEVQPPVTGPEGIPYPKMNAGAQRLLQRLVETYCQSMPSEVAEERFAQIEKGGWDKIHFAWAGADRPGIGHYYRVQGPSFLIEFNNTQADAEGNPANHIHAVWRDATGDFDLPIGS